MALQKVFAKNVRFYFPSVFPSHLESVDELDVGSVLIYQRKPRPLMPWRKHELEFTNCPITKLLAEGETLSIKTTGTLLLETGPAVMSREVQLDAEAGMQEALLRLGLLADVKEDKKLTITTDLGKVTHVTSDLFDQLSIGRHRVNTGHAVVREAVKRGGTMFIVSTLYTADKLKIQIEVSERVDEKAGNKDSTKNEEASKTASSSEVVTRDQATPIGFMVVRVLIDPEGLLVPVLNTGLGSNPKIGEDVDSGLSTTSSKAACYIHGPLDISGFSGHSYRNIAMEVSQMVLPLVNNRGLQQAYRSLIDGSLTNEMLMNLAHYLSTIQNTIGSHPLPSSSPDLSELVKSFSQDSCQQQNELVALQITVEACIEFAPHVIRTLIALPQSKRDLLFDLIKRTPYGSYTHVYMGLTQLYSDSDLYPVLIQTGFSVTNSNLTYTHPSEDTDLLAAIIVVLEALPPSQELLSPSQGQPQ